MKKLLLRCAGLLAFSFLLSCKKENDGQTDPEVFRASGDVTATLNAFKNSLGPANTLPGATGGRRDLTWDGVPDTALNKPLPKNFFNPVEDGALPALQRGLLYGEGDFEVSATGFSHLNNAAAAEFTPFSGNKVFTNTSDFAWPLSFQVAGQDKAASVSAFGMVFSDVDAEGSTTLEFFDGATSLGTFAVPAKSNGFSFLGVRFSSASITKVQVRHQGRLADGGKDLSQGGTVDLVVMDDVVYSEPVAL